jgi:hypothetical protein
MAENNDLTEDEMAVLMIADQGEFMLAIGRWKKPIADLTTKGFMKLEYINGGPQFTITDAGRAAMTKQDNDNVGSFVEAWTNIARRAKALLNG